MSWICHFQLDDFCKRLKKLCKPGIKGCILDRKVRFIEIMRDKKVCDNNKIVENKGVKLADNFRDFFKNVEPIRLKEPLAETLGVFKEKDAILEYSFSDVVKMAGHACPTVSLAFLCCKKALKVLFPDEIPIRGNIKITVYGEPDEGSLGVIAQVFSYITGASPNTGFKGLGGKFRRKDLLKFEPGQNSEASFKFERIDTNQKVLVKIYPRSLPNLGEREEKMKHLLEKIIWDAAKEDELLEFQNLWMEKVKGIVVDEGNIDNWLKLEREA